ncbi:MAG: nicotinate phosphoribosyltransferase [Spirochaetaceae bacterium]|nr:MAG: nicotinate phosphoribosyltransferase [Spirochaetaceae bacterium]
MSARHTSALLTDLYELTMVQGYHHYELNPQVVFDMFFRRQPFQGGFSVFAGLQELIDTLEGLRFSSQDIEYLRGLGTFTDRFLTFLADFRFTGDLYAVPEGTVVFPQEPLVRVHSSLIEAQLIESLLLNILNFQTLIATKAARIYLASNKGKVLEFGLRRAQGIDGAMSASRAAFIGGAAATSNTLAGKRYGIPVSGTMAHSWVMAFQTEREAFERFAELYPDGTTLLIDTYDTLGSGISNAIAVGRKLCADGHPFAVRLDSGDIQYLSGKVRAELDAAGLTQARIAASNELNEEIIHQLVSAHSPIDLWGVGTHMVTGGSESSFSGVYKLAAQQIDGRFEPRMKVSDNPEKSTNPGVKQVHRFYDNRMSPLADLVTFEDEVIELGKTYNFHHPYMDYRKRRLSTTTRVEPLIQLQMKEGKAVRDPLPLEEIQRNSKHNLDALDPTFTRIINPHIYKVSISDRVKDSKQAMLKHFLINGDLDS